LRRRVIPRLPVICIHGHLGLDGGDLAYQKPYCILLDFLSNDPPEFLIDLLEIGGYSGWKEPREEVLSNVIRCYTLRPARQKEFSCEVFFPEVGEAAGSSS